MKEINKIIIEGEKTILNYIDRHKFTIIFAIVFIISCLTRISMIEFQSDDYTEYLSKWFEEIKENGGLSALNQDIGNYNAPYMTILAILTNLPFNKMYMIKAVSIVFDYVCAFAILKIACDKFENSAHRKIYNLVAFSLTLFLPTVMLNSACWAQADSIYTAFILISLIYLMKEKYFWSFVFLGISFAFKLQFMFILPLYILVYIARRKFPIYYFGIIPIMNIIMSIPAIIIGWPVEKCFSIYIEQMYLHGTQISVNFPNIYNLIFKTSDNCATITVEQTYFGRVCTLITICIFALIALAVMYKKIEFNKRQIIKFGLLSIMIATFFLPHMHERYLYVADILSIAYVMYNKEKWYIIPGISAVSMYGYSYFLFEQNVIPIQYVSILYLILIIIVSKDIICNEFKFNTENNLMEKKI